MGEVFFQHVETGVWPALEVLVPFVPMTLANQLDLNKNDFLVSLVGGNDSLIFQVVYS